eukprot:scaffold98408_cov37-Prasinocladus_malaysianus.AAC.1
MADWTTGAKGLLTAGMQCLESTVRNLPKASFQPGPEPTLGPSLMRRCWMMSDPGFLPLCQTMVRASWSRPWEEGRNKNCPICGRRNKHNQPAVS